MAHAINKTTFKEETGHTPNYDPTDWIIYRRGDIAAWEAAVAIPVEYRKVVDNVIVEMTQEEKDVVDSNNLLPYKISSITKLSAQLQAFILTHYDDKTQSSLEAFHSRAVEKGMLDRAFHIAQVIDWLEDVLNNFYSKKAAILAAADEVAVDAITVDWEAEYGDTGTSTPDPKVTIESALGVTH